MALTVGIRPEHVRLEPGGLPLVIDLVEPLGSETVLLGRLPDETLLSVKVSGSWTGGERTDIMIPPASLHVFDGKRGLRLDPIT
jgi:sn-glycerol 3-phosphate transport system ATP-binding protein